MAGSRTGTPSIIKMSRKICKLFASLGAVDLATKTSVEFQAAIVALTIACAAFDALDDYPAEIDRTAPFGPGDIN